MEHENQPVGPPSPEQIKKWKEKSEIKSGLSRASQLINSGILWDANFPVYYDSVLTELLIHMKDLIKKAEMHGFKVNSTKDVRVNPARKINDVSDLICNFRDAMCHSDSHRKMYGGISLTIRMAGKINSAIQIGSMSLGNPYDDDFGFATGDQVLLLKRHIEFVFSKLLVFFENSVLNQQNPE